MKIDFKKAVGAALDKTDVDEKIGAEIGSLLASHAAANDLAKKRQGESFRPLAHNELQIKAAVERVLADSSLFDVLREAITAEAIRSAIEQSKAPAAVK